MKNNSENYSWLRMISIGLGVLGIGLAIAFAGYYFTMKNSIHNNVQKTQPIPTVTK